jgi:hypothetical protein
MVNPDWKSVPDSGERSSNACPPAGRRFASERFLGRAAAHALLQALDVPS